MAATLFLQSMWVGLAIAAPVGPIGVFVIQRILRHGVPVGLATGLGAAVADAAYGAVGAYGVTGLIAWLQGARMPLALAGGAFLLWLAWCTWSTPPAATGGGATAARAFRRRLAAPLGACVGIDAGGLCPVAVGVVAGALAVAPSGAGNDETPPRRGLSMAVVQRRPGRRVRAVQELGCRTALVATTCAAAAWRAICRSAAGCEASRSTLARMDSVMKAAKPKAVTRALVRAANALRRFI
ncbi:MAG: LysE family transporter [Rubrivivax sp.]|nr:LysE family transporter [Rubrivivax sp.]